jgi:hypothetical protein
VDVVLSVITVAAALSCLATLMVNDFRDYKNWVFIKKQHARVTRTKRWPGM